MRAAGWADAPLLVPPPDGLADWLSAGIAVQLQAGAEGPMLSRFPAGAFSAIVVTLEGRFGLLRDGDTHLLPAAFASGPATRPVTLSHSGLLRCAAVMVRPAAAAALFESPGALVDVQADAAAVLDDGWSGLDARLRSAGPHEALRVLFEMVRRLAAEPSRQVRRAIAATLQDDSLRGVAEAARRLGCSIRQFERRFTEAFGLPPKRFHRLARAEVAMRVALAAGRCDAEVAQRLGYFDQSHLGRDLRELAGLTPSQVARMPAADDPSWWPLRVGAAYPANGIRADFAAADASLFS